MTHYNWDEALGAEGLLALTEEAVTPPRRGRVPLRRRGGAAGPPCGGWPPWRPAWAWCWGW